MAIYVRFLLRLSLLSVKLFFLLTVVSVVHKKDRADARNIEQGEDYQLEQDPYKLGREYMKVSKSAVKYRE